MSRIKFVLTGGATGGHFYPLMAIAEAVNDEVTARGTPKPDLYYMGPDKFDAESLSAHNIIHIPCPAGKLRRYFSFLNYLDFFKTLWGMVVALWKLFAIYPDAIMSKGGYTSVPVTFVGWFLRIPIVIHESDVVAGRANKLAAKHARYIGISYQHAPEEFPIEKVAYIGIPIRTPLLEPMMPHTSQTLGFDEDLPIILVLGGSQGAERINALILDTLDELLPRYNIFHLTGAEKFENIKNSAASLITDKSLTKRYIAKPYLPADLLHQAYTTATVVVSRAGSGVIHEIAIHGKPAILIPIPEDISHDQTKNAYAYARTGAATVLEEKNLKDGLLEAEIARIIDDPNLYNAMTETAKKFAPRNASKTLANTLISIGDEH